LHTTIFFAVHKFDFLAESGSYFLKNGSLIIKGALFAVKYHVFYGLPSIVNKCARMKTTPLPRCVFMMHTTGELWKNFDSGIYEFIKKYTLKKYIFNFLILKFAVLSYLYIPLGGNKISRFRQVVAIVCSFLFMSLWHGN
jgi:hypothetical protein